MDGKKTNRGRHDVWCPTQQEEAGRFFSAVWGSREAQEDGEGKGNIIRGVTFLGCLRPAPERKGMGKVTAILLKPLPYSRRAGKGTSSEGGNDQERKRETLPYRQASANNLRGVKFRKTKKRKSGQCGRDKELFFSKQKTSWWVDVRVNKGVERKRGEEQAMKEGVSFAKSILRRLGAGGVTSNERSLRSLEKNLTGGPNLEERKSGKRKLARKKGGPSEKRFFFAPFKGKGFGSIESGNLCPYSF